MSRRNRRSIAVRRWCQGLLVLAALAGVVSAAPRVTITAIDPAQGATLPPREALNVRVQYESDQPLRIQAEGLLGGTERTAAMSNASPAYPAGAGEAIAWIAYDSGGIEEVRVVAHDAQWHPLASTTAPADIEWTSAATRPVARAEWVARLNAEQQAAIQRGVREAAAQPTSPAASLTVSAMFLSVPAYFLLQFMALYGSRGRNRTAALAPLFLVGPVLAFSLFALARGSNLWPIWLLFACPL